MPVQVQVPTKNQINELRNLFLQKYDKNPPSDPFHPVDIDRVKNGDIWCQRFLEMYDLDMKVSFEKLWETCIWRQQYGANDLNETNLREEYLKDGVIFGRNKDSDGKPLLIFKTKLHLKGTKDMAEVMRVVVYWIERIHREHNLELITVFFDMAGTGLSNMDLEFVKGIINTFKMYYPNALNYILIFEMAWVLNAAFKIVKGLLPPKAHEILKIITKKDINQYIDLENCLTSWGGNDNYEFSFVPEQKQPSIAEPTISSVLPEQTNDVIATDQTNGLEKDKKVHFANSSPTRLTEMTEFKDPATPQDPDMLRVTPNDVIQFSREENAESIIEVLNISKFTVSYKIQTTSPDKFRVRPRYGFITPGDKILITILLKPDHHLSFTSKDKFLIMSMAVPANVNSNVQPAELWVAKTVNTLGVGQHRLICAYKDSGESQVDSFGESTLVYDKMGQSSGRVFGQTDGSSKHSKLENQLRTTQILQWITLAFVILLSVGFGYLLHRQTSLTQSSSMDNSQNSIGNADATNQRTRT